jgi:hypothetical protein
MGSFTFLGRRRRRGLLAVLAIAVAAVGVAIPGTANLAGSSFESDDGNLVVNDGAGSKDWENAPNLAIGVDDEQTSTDNAYVGGAKHDTSCPDAETGGIPPNKDDLTRLYVSNEQVGSDIYLYMAWERFLDKESSASAHMGFEFNQSTTPCGGDSQNVVRTPNDMLILYDLEGGGTPVFELLRWVTAANDLNGAADCKAASALPCWGQGQTLGDNVAEGEVNRTAPITDPVLAPGQTQPRTLGFTNMFGEAAINLTAAGVFQAGQCQGFGRATLGSRSSGNSFVSTQKDFVGPLAIDLRNCGTIVIKKETTPEENPNTTNFGYSTTGGLTPSTFTLQDDGTRTYADVPAGTYSVSEGALAGWDLGSISCTKSSGGTSTTSNDLPNRKVTINLAASETVTCTFNNTKRGTIIVEKQTDPNGLTDSFGFTAGSPLSPSTFTLQDNGTRTYSNLVPGTYTVNEDAKGGFALVSIVCTDPTSNSSGNTSTRRATFNLASGETVRCVFTNRQTHNIVVLVCHENTDTLVPSSVTLGSQTKTSLSGSGLTAAQQKALCETGGANFGGRPHGTSSLSVNIPTH